MNLELNHATRRLADAVDHSAHVLIAVPGGVDGPSGVQGILIVAHATHTLKDSPFPIQSEHGDLYKDTLNHADDFVSEVQAKYFDTVPFANALYVFMTGFLFAAAVFGNHARHQLQGIGPDDGPMCTSPHSHRALVPVAFKPRSFKNRRLDDDMPSLLPIIDMMVLEATGKGKQQLYTLCGRGPRYLLRGLRHGLAAAGMVMSELPGS